MPAMTGIPLVMACVKSMIFTCSASHGGARHIDMKQFGRRIAHGEQARLACPAGQWPPLDTEVTPDGGPGIEGHVPAPPRMYGTAAAVAACHEAPGPSWHDDELGGHTYATAAE